MNWNDVQKHEAAYWRDCYSAVAFGEVQKQEMYAREMQIIKDYGDEHGDFDLRGNSILDLGCGPWSMLLRGHNTDRLVGVDPLEWPPSVLRRYKNYGIEFVRQPAEEFEMAATFDEVWIYNVLQHVQDPGKVIEVARKLAPVVRIFEWLYIPADDCHPHVLTPDAILNWFAGCKINYVGIPRLKEYWCEATAFTGIFTTM